MTANSAPRPSFGRALGETSSQIGKLHRRALADFDTDFPTWMLLTLMAEKGVPLSVDVHRQRHALFRHQGQEHPGRKVGVEVGEGATVQLADLARGLAERAAEAGPRCGVRSHRGSPCDVPTGRWGP